jgi:hypothetical protein
MQNREADTSESGDPIAAMREMRLLMLTSPASDFEIEKSREFPSVYGVVMDFPIDDFIATIVALCDGNASLYTTAGFGVMGGFAYESVRAAATRFVDAANHAWVDSTPTSEFSYPDPERIRFYYLTFSGVRMIETDFASTESGENYCSPLFELGQEVFTQLRLTAEE